MAKDIDQLSVTLTAQIDQFQSNMRQAGQTFDREASQIEDRNQALTSALNSQMQGVGAGVTLLASTLKGLISIAAVDTLIQAFNNAEKALASLNRQADETRLTVQDLLSLRVAGAGAGVSTDELNKALAFFSDQSKKTQEDARGLYKALDQVGPGFRQAFADAPSQGARLELVSKAMRSLTDETKRDQLEMGAFGTSSDRLKAVLDTMNGSLDTLAQRATDAGINLDSGLAERADEAQKKLALLSEIMTDKLMIALANMADVIRDTVVPAFASLLPFLETTAKEIGLIVTAYNTLATAAQLYAATGHIPDPRSVGASVRADASDYIEPDPRHRDPVERPLTVGLRSGAFKPTRDLSRKPAATSEDEFDREERRLEKLKVTIAGQTAAYGKLGEAQAFAEAKARLLQAANEAGLPITAALTDKIDRLATAYAKVKAAAEELKLAQDLVFQRSQLGRSADEQAIYSDLRGRGIDPEAERGKELADEMRTIRNLTDAKEGASSFIKGMIQDMENGVRAGKALENQLKRILDKLADKALDKLISGAFGGIGGMFGGGGYGASDYASAAASAAPGSYGPGFASGGLVGRDGTPTWIPAAALRGARQFAIGGGIPAILHAGEIVLNQAQQKNVAQSMVSKPGNINLTHAPVISGTGLSKEEVFSLLQRNNREFARQIGPIFSDWQRRFS